MSRVLLSLGSNQGDREENILNALRALHTRGAALTRVSSFYETPPWGNTLQSPFFNLCAEADTALSPYALLSLLHTIEQEGGRERKIHWGPRTIDIDILLWEGVEVSEKHLTIPHPYWMERAFVLAPLLELFPQKKAYGYDFSAAAEALAGEITEIRRSKGRPCHISTQR